MDNDTVACEARLREQRVANMLSFQLEELKRVCQELDKIKKYVFYNKPCQIDAAPNDYLGDFVDVRVVHSILGLVTESGELAEKLAQQIFSDIVYDSGEMRKEYGDIQWYTALGLNSLESTIGENMSQNGT